jgi:hypothetical protein
LEDIGVPKKTVLKEALKKQGLVFNWLDILLNFIIASLVPPFIDILNGVMKA